MLCTVCLGLLILFLLFKGRKESEAGGLQPALGNFAARQIQTQLTKVFTPVFSFVEEDQTMGAGLLTERQMIRIMPLYGYGDRKVEEAARVEDRMTIEMILLAEAGDEGSGPSGETDTSAVDGTAPEGSGAQNSINQEGTVQGTTEPGISDQGNSDLGAGLAGENVQGIQNGEDIQAMMEEENLAAGGNQAVLPGTQAAFVPHTLQNKVELDSLRDYETLLSDFYTVDKTTMIGSDQLNVDSLMNKDMTVSKDAPGPQILIYHTHSQEAFADSVPGDSSDTIMGVGEHLAAILRDEYGYEVLHHTGQYDVESRDDAYSRSLPAIEQVLEENPSIQVVIDLHRDAMAEGTHLVMDLDGRPTARFMFFNGLSRTRKTGNISYLYNENLESNLAFSFQMQLKAVQYYPGLTRKIYLKGYRYNMHLRPKTLLIELGAQNNTLEEVMNACEPMAHILDMVLSGE